MTPNGANHLKTSPLSTSQFLNLLFFEKINRNEYFLQNEKFGTVAAASPAPLADDRDGLGSDPATSGLDPEQHGHVPVRLRRTPHGLLLVQQVTLHLSIRAVLNRNLKRMPV